MKIITKFIILLGFYSLSLSFCNLPKQNNKEVETIDSNIIKDFDGNIYHSIKIENQIWLKENLKVTHYRNGDDIPNIKNSDVWNADIKGAYCNYNNDSSQGTIYGRLYNWYAVNDKRNLCPKGWHIPTSFEFSDLNFTFGGPFISGMQLKEAGTTHWKEPNDATNASNFTALPGGHRDEKGFWWIGSYAFFWNKEAYFGEGCSKNNGCAWECSLNSESSYFNHDWGFKNRGMSVRCIKDSLELIKGK